MHKLCIMMHSLVCFIYAEFVIPLHVHVLRVTSPSFHCISNYAQQSYLHLSPMVFLPNALLPFVLLSEKKHPTNANKQPPENLIVEVCTLPIMDIFFEWSDIHDCSILSQSVHTSYK